MSSLPWTLALHRVLEDRVGRVLDLAAREGWTDEVEAVHQVRVGTRRLRALFPFLDPRAYPALEGAVRRTRRITRLLGPVREADIQLARAESLAPESGVEAGHAVLEHLLEDLDRLRKKARRGLGRDIAATKPGALKNLLEFRGPWAVDPACPPPSLGSLLGPGIRRAREDAERALKGEDPETLHQLRIRIKKLRYTLEILGPLGPEKPQEWLEGLRKLQVALGDHHDWTVLEADLWRRHAFLTERGRSRLAAGFLDLLGAVVERRRSAFEAAQEAGALLDLPSLAAWAGAAEGPP
ncbi:MAG: CHAD domain-containing protein [Acidobacteria bacterium]|nr:CHAD domain-containing protein [Acidobacteriota bacterium]